MILTHRPTGISAQASERRTQGENRRTALHRLRLELALTVRRPIPNKRRSRPYAASTVWRNRCRGGRIHANTMHDDFPAKAEALDVLLASGDDPKVAARLLGCSPTQLIRLLEGGTTRDGVDQRTSPSSRTARPAVTEGARPAGRGDVDGNVWCWVSLGAARESRSGQFYPPTARLQARISAERAVSSSAVNSSNALPSRSSPA